MFFYLLHVAYVLRNDGFPPCRRRYDISTFVFMVSLIQLLESCRKNI